MIPNQFKPIQAIMMIRPTKMIKIATEPQNKSRKAQKKRSQRNSKEIKERIRTLNFQKLKKWKTNQLLSR